MLVPPEVSMAMLAAEFDPAASWAGRHGWRLTLDLASLHVSATFAHPDGRELHLVGVFDEYPALPPRWKFQQADGSLGLAAWPAPPTASTISSMFITASSGPVVCAHFSRDAYGEHGGPHADWGAASRWQAIDQGVHATTLPDMLAAIARHVALSPGRMS